MKYNLIFGIIITGLLAYLIFSHNGVLKYYDLLTIKQSYEAQISELETKVSSLEKQLELIEKDKAYLELLVRKELGMIKPGEDLYLLEDEKVHRK